MPYFWMACATLAAGMAPPPPRMEVLPPPRVGYVWAPGQWEWVGGRHAWIGGVWMPARPGYVYHGPEWRQRHGHWVYYEGRWGRH